MSDVNTMQIPKKSTLKKDTTSPDKAMIDKTDDSQRWRCTAEILLRDEFGKEAKTKQQEVTFTKQN